MKLNYKRTIFVGFAFFLICAFWQIYDVTIAMTLTSKFGLSQTASGVVMALDNILALFMLPLFGKISDNHKGNAGRRTPFIRTGTVLAVVFLMLLSIVDYMQLSNIEPYTAINNPVTMERIYDEQKDNVLKTPEGTEYTLAEVFTREEAGAMRTRVGIRNGSLSQMLNNWKGRGYIELYGEEGKRTEENLQSYIKTEEYLRRHGGKMTIDK